MIKQILTAQLTDSQKEYIYWDSEATQTILSALDRAIVDNSNTLSTVYWAQQYPRQMKAISFCLSELGYGQSIIKRKWAEFKLNTSKLLEFVTQDEIDQYKITKQMSKYLMRLDTSFKLSRRVRVNGKTAITGLVRRGFQKVAKYEFSYDTNMITKYKSTILANMVKTITKATKEGKIKDKFFDNPANYSEIASMCLDHYEKGGKLYNLEYNESDTRGRSIFNALKRVGNPIQYKDFRALLVMPEPIIVSLSSTVELEDIYYFIAELTGSKATTESGKFADGQLAYLSGDLPSTDADDLHERIWLERIYAQLDEVYEYGSTEWVVPLEVDASQSVAQIAGALTNDRRLLSSTNVIGYKLTDPWYIDGVRRQAAKLKGTPTFYGSSASAKALISKKNYLHEQLLPDDATAEQIAEAKQKDADEIAAIEQQFTTGRFSVLNKMKDAIINGYSNHKPKIDVTIWDDSFYVPVNKFKSAGSELVVTEAWDTKSQQFKYAITHKPILIPDYEYMKLYWQTGLIHNLDSQICNKIPLRVDEWMLTIHDAVIMGPGVARRVRETYASLLQEVHTNRHTIIESYRQSIGATGRKSDIAFMELYNMTQHCVETPVFKRTAMK